MVMKLCITISRQNPINVEEIKMEDVASWEVDDNYIRVKFNSSPDELISLRGNDGVSQGDWVMITVIGTRVGLKIDMSQ